MPWLTERPIAHRGLHSADAPENSLAAVRRAVDEGYAVEIDVRPTADGVPVVFHDTHLSRLTDRSARVADVTWDEVRDLSLEPTDEPIPRLADVLAVVDGDVPLLVELKNRHRPGTLESAVVDRLAAYDGPFAVQSFNPLVLRYLRKNRPGWPRGQVAGFYEGSTDVAWYQRAVLKRLLLNWVSRPDFIAYEHERLPYWPVTFHRMLGLPVLAWVVRTPAALERATRVADNVIFEDIRP